MEYYTGVLQHPETHKQYYPITLWDLIVGKPTNFSDVYNSTINLYAGTQASHTSIGSFSVNSSSNVDIYFPVVSTQAMGLVPVLDSDTNHYLRGDGTWATPAGGGGGEENVQSDWEETNTESDAYILHKPDVDKVKQTANTGSTLKYLLLGAGSSGFSSGNNDYSLYSTKALVNPSSGSIVLQSGTNNGDFRTELRLWSDVSSGTSPIVLWKKVSGSWTAESNRLLSSDGILPAPTAGKFLKYESTGFAWADTPAGSDTTYQLTLNGTTNGDSTGGVDLGTLYAPTGAGTSGYILKSNGSGAPSWDTLINIIGNKTEHYVLAGNSSGNVSWQQLDLDALSDTPTENKITLNGTDNVKFLRANGTSGDLTFYAPTSGKAINNLLLSQGTGANPPTWTNFTFPTSSGTTMTLNYVGGTGWTIQELMSAASTSSTYHGYLLMHPVSGSNQEMKYNTQVFTGFDGSTGYVLAGNTSSNTDMVYLQGSLTTPILLKSGSNVIPNKLIHSSGVIAAPTGSSGDTKYLKADIGNNNSVTFGWATISSGTDTWRNVQVNGTQILGTGTSTGALNLVAGTGVSLSSSGGAVTIAATGASNNPKHLDAWGGRAMPTNCHFINAMDAPFYCTDLYSPTYTSGNFHAFPGGSAQWGVHDIVSMPEHITIWPRGNHCLDYSLSSQTGTGYDNWLGCMMTSWAAGHPMSISIVRDGTRKWIPLIYTGPLKMSDGTIKSVAIDLGAAIIINMYTQHNGAFPFDSNTGTYSVTHTFATNYSIGMTPVTFRYFAESYTNDCDNSYLPSGSGSLNGLMVYINELINETVQGFSFSYVDKTLIADWETYSGAAGDEAISTIGGTGIIFQTWEEILDARDEEDEPLYDEGVLVCTALPNVTCIQ